MRSIIVEDMLIVRQNIEILKESMNIAKSEITHKFVRSVIIKTSEGFSQ